jgi:Ca-activated chloride channel family protein
MLERTAAAALAGSLLLQQPIRDPRVFRTDTQLVSVNATVVDREGRLVTGLTRDDFEVFEDGVSRPIAQFTNERVPIGLGVLLDVSDSMFGQRLNDARVAVERLLFDRLAADDEFFVLAFNHASNALTSWTRDAPTVQRALEGLKPFGGTAVYDAVLSAMPLVVRRERQRGALLVISDGADTASDASIRDVRSALLRSDAFVYAIAIDVPSSRAINTRINAQALREITDSSGGRTEVIHSMSELDDALARISTELNSQYLIGYEPAGPARRPSTLAGDDGRFHSIRVRVPRGEYRVRARSGYVAVPRQ